jgi:hypothetical protein
MARELAAPIAAASYTEALVVTEEELRSDVVDAACRIITVGGFVTPTLPRRTLVGGGT